MNTRPTFMLNLPLRSAPAATCLRCRKQRTLPEGKRPLTDLCASCMMEIEFELKVKSKGE